MILWIIVISLIAFKMYFMWNSTMCTSKMRMEGKTVIITGSNTGIGKETARDLARRGAKVILACRDLDKAKIARDDIVKTTGNNSVEIQHLDLSSLSSVRTFAKTIIESESRLDVLINNAGLGGIKKTKTKDNLEMTMQVNHFGHFLLTCLLLDLLKKSAPSRIVIVSSWLHSFAFLDFDNLHGEKWYISLHQYCVSKLANILTTKELAKKLNGTDVTVNCLHPGTIVSDVWRNVHPILREIIVFILKIFCKDVVEGAQTTIHLAVAEEVEGVSGKYFWECKESPASKTVMDERIQRKMWEISEDAVGLKPEERNF